MEYVSILFGSSGLVMGFLAVANHFALRAQIRQKDRELGILEGKFGAELLAKDQEIKRIKKKEALEHIRPIIEKLDTDPELLKIQVVLNDEKNKRPNDTAIDGKTLRNLPALLDDIARLWETESVDIGTAYEYFSAPMLLCSESKILWEDDPADSRAIHWRKFDKFLVAIQKEHRRRGEQALAFADPTKSVKADNPR